MSRKRPLDPEELQRRMRAEKEKLPAPRGIGKHPEGCTCGFCVRIRSQVVQAAEKEAQGKKVRRRLSVRARRFTQEFSNPTGPAFRNATQAAVLAGYSPDSAESIGANLLRDERVQKSVVRAMERHGITEDYLAQRLKEGMEAHETKFFQHEGHVVEEREVIDWHARHKFTDTTLRVRGDLGRDEGPALQAALIIRLPDRMTREDWQQRMAKRLPAAKLQEGKPGDPKE